MEKLVILLGPDHTNTLGVLQSLGERGVHVICVLWGVRQGLVRASKYGKRIYTAHTANDCIELILKEFSTVGGLIIPCNDDAVLAIDDNKERLKPYFCYENSSNFSLRELQLKGIQVEMATQCGFKVPLSKDLLNVNDFPEDFPMPCIVRPSISNEAGKGDIFICETKEDAISRVKSILSHTKKVLIQQYISKDFDYNIIGCALSSGECILPGLIKKHKLFPLHIGLGTVQSISPHFDSSLAEAVGKLISYSGYVGLFDVELVHSIDDNCFYFVETNLRNSGSQRVVCKAGVNLPYIHYCDMLGIPYNDSLKAKSTMIIWEIHHLMSLIRRETSFKEWLADIVHADGWLVFSIKDVKPLFAQFFRIFGEKIGLIKHQTY